MGMIKTVLAAENRTQPSSLAKVSLTRRELNIITAALDAKYQKLEKCRPSMQFRVAHAFQMARVAELMELMADTEAREISAGNWERNED